MLIKHIVTFLLALIISTTSYAGGCSSLLSMFFKSESINHDLEGLLFSAFKKQALTTKHPGLAQELEAIEQLIPQTSLTRRHLERKLGRAPTVEEMIIDFNRQFQEQFLPRLDKVGNLDPLLKTFSEATHKDIEKPIKNLPKSVRKHPEIYNAIFDSNNDNHNSILSGYLGRAYGEMGEIKAASRTQNLISHGRHFSNFGEEINPKSIRIAELITQKINFMKKRLQYSDIEEMVKKYPHIFHATNRNGDALSIEEVLDQGIRWLQTKEIDIINNDQIGKMAWIEVKNYSHIIDMNTFTGHYPGGKSIQDQLRSYVEIVEFLELENVVNLKVRFEGAGSTREVDQLISSMGIEVI